jgi:steroid delta-isomerase-like uncharacterized protein
MTRSEIQTLVDSWIHAWAAADVDALLACYDAQAQLGSPMLRNLHGIAEIERSHQDLFVAFTDQSVDVHDVIIDTERQQAVLVFTIHATHRAEFHGFPASGKRVATPMAFVFHLKDGRIIAERRLYDFGGVLMQLGIIKARPA